MQLPKTFRTIQLSCAVVLTCLTVGLSAQGAEPVDPPPVSEPQGAEPQGAEPQGSKEAATPDSEEAAAAALQEKIDKAIAAYEKVRKDKKKLAQRRRQLGWLGEIDDARVTKYLIKDLKRYAKWVSGTYSIEAMGKVDRPDLEPELLKVIQRKDANHAVRIAAVKAMLGFGKRSLSRLLDLIEESKDAKVRRGVVEGLAASDSSDAMRGLAELLSSGDHGHRLFMLAGTRSVSGNAKIDRARVSCVRDGNLIVAATAWRLLAEQGHRRAKSLTVDVLERVYDKPDAKSAAELVRGLVLVGDPDFFPAILRFGATRGRQVRGALKSVADIAGKNSALVEFLIEEGIESESPAQRAVAKILLAKAPASAVAPLVERIRKQLRRNRKSVLDSAAGLHELLAKDPTWVQDLHGLATASDFESRMLGLSMLMEMGSPIAITSAQRYLKNRAWELRSLSLRYLTKCRDATSIPKLIARYGKEDGRLGHELDTALFVHTGTRCWKRKDWQNWWRLKKVGFALPHENSIKGGGTTSGGKTVSYYDIPLVSSRIAFLVDHSGSMRERVGTDRKRTRLDAAKEQLQLVVSALPKTHKVNLIPFETNVNRAWRDLQALSPANRKKLLELISMIPLAGGTNTYGALMAAFDDPEVDTIYLLTDGQPTQGEITNADDILEAVQRENRTRQIVIHCISIGLDSTLLQDLAALTGGQYKYVR